MGGGRIKKRGEERTKKRGRDEKGLEVNREREEICGERERGGENFDNVPYDLSLSYRSVF